MATMTARKLILAVILVVLGSLQLVVAQTATPDASREPLRAIAFYPEATGQGTYFIANLQPGESTIVNVVLGNAGEIEQTLRTYAIPARSAVNGGFNLAPYGTEFDEVTNWLTYEEQVFTFQPGEGVSIPFEIAVPADAAPGEYVTGLAAEQAEPFEVPGTPNLTQRVRWAVPVLVVVPGERQPAVEFGDATLENRDGLLIANIGVANTGNVIIRPEGEARLLDQDGSVVGISSFWMDSVYAGTDTTFGVVWQNIPESDSYTIEISLTVEDGSVEASETFSEITPFSTSGDNVASSTPLSFSSAELTPLTDDNPPSMLQLDAEITNSGEPIESARVSIVTYQDGVEVDRYPVMQAVTIQQGTTPVQARYALPGGFTSGTYTFEVTIELGSIGTQTVLVTHKLEYTVAVP